MAHVKSNTVIFTDAVRTLAIGAGQMSRVDAVKVAVNKAGGWKREGALLKGSVAASDAFFPFRDGLDAVAAAGATPVGLKTLASCRMEKGYRDFGHDIDNTDNVIEVGLGFAVDLDKPNFIGRDAVARIKAAGVPHRRLVQVRLTDPGPVLHHAELVLRDGEVVGYVRAASYGWTLGGAVGLALLEAGEPVTADWIKAGTWTVDVAGTEHEAVVSLRPMYDPTNERIKA
jgi:4-methylaminobutanoate oxidase (formaldehyde-forming)